MKKSEFLCKLSEVVSEVQRVWPLDFDGPRRTMAIKGANRVGISIHPLASTKRNGLLSAILHLATISRDSLGLREVFQIQAFSEAAWEYYQEKVVK